MPSRVIRGDDLLESDRYMSLPATAQVFYIHLMLCADDFGLVPLSPLSIGRRCFRTRPGPAKIESLVELLAEADLIRRYEFDGAPFAFLPRFRQRLKNFRCRHPMPPRDLFEDDEDARLIFTKYKDLFKKQAPSGGGPAATSGKSRPESKRSDLEGVSKGSDLESEVRPLIANAGGTSTEVNPGFIEKGSNGNGKFKGAAKGSWAKAIELGLAKFHGETITDFIARVEDAYEKARATP